MLDILIIYLLLNKEYYIKYNHLVNLEELKTNNKNLYYVMLVLHKMQEDAPSLYSAQDLALAFFTKYPALKEDQQEYYEAIFKDMAAYTIEEGQVETFFMQYKERSTAYDIAKAALEVYEGKKEFKSITEIMSAHDNTKVASSDFNFVSDDLTVLYESTLAHPGLRWRLDFLNKSLGSLRKGDFGFLYARPETGKTTFLASEVSNMALQIEPDESIYWFNNEEQGEKVKLRLFQAVFGISQRDLFSNLGYYNDQYADLIGTRIKLLDSASISRNEIERILSEGKPRMIVYDQIDKLKGFKGEGVDLFKSIYVWGREIAKEYAPSLGVCQASASGEGKLFLGMEDVDASKTAKAAEADFMFGIGKSDKENEYTRGIAINKNKLSGDHDSEDALRHGRRRVLIVPTIARYQEMGG